MFNFFLCQSIVEIEDIWLMSSNPLCVVERLTLLSAIFFFISAKGNQKLLKAFLCNQQLQLLSLFSAFPVINFLHMFFLLRDKNMTFMFCCSPNVEVIAYVASQLSVNCSLFYCLLDV